MRYQARGQTSSSYAVAYRGADGLSYSENRTAKWPPTCAKCGVEYRTSECYDCSRKERIASEVGFFFFFFCPLLTVALQRSGENPLARLSGYNELEGLEGQTAAQLAARFDLAKLTALSALATENVEDYEASHPQILKSGANISPSVLTQYRSKSALESALKKAVQTASFAQWVRHKVLFGLAADILAPSDRTRRLGKRNRSKRSKRNKRSSGLLRRKRQRATGRRPLRPSATAVRGKRQRRTRRNLFRSRNRSRSRNERRPNRKARRRTTRRLRAPRPRASTGARTRPTANTRAAKSERID
jgi:hypothetical protein